MLVGKKVKLRGLKIEDVELAYQYMTESEVLLNLSPGIPYPMTLERERKWFESQIEMEDTYNFSIEDIKTGLYIGGCGINKIDWKNRVATVGIYIGDGDFRGKGYGTEAMSLLIKFIFDQMNINRIQLFVFSFNERAIKSYKKNGFTVEGRLKQSIFRNGKYHDEIIMSILREDYLEIK
ncbi:GNAT family protein [Proteiniborus sp.]|uniref:GNAT family N-acetyltransferase n=1 Tax=Proteiniborus sp. TaxID=2079015 RepID=UPI003323005B